MPTPIPYTLTGPTCAFLRRVLKWNDVKFAGLLARSPLEPQTEEGVYSVNRSLQGLRWTPEIGPGAD